MLPTDTMVNAIRALAIDAVEAAKSGHPGMPMGMADVAATLWAEHLRFDPLSPHWPDRDRFILSGGHGSMLQYALMHLTGYEDMPIEEIRNFRQWGSRAAGHPEYGHARGIETTTGPLGQGIANAVGMAIAEHIQAAKYGEIVNHYTYVLAGDGDLMEGISHEAASLAGHLKLSKLILLFDDNGISIDGATSLSVSEDVSMRFEAYGFDVQHVDGHDRAAVSRAIAQAKTTSTPSLIACKTVIGFGAPTKAGTSASHGSPLGADEAAKAKAALGWEHAPFVIPDEVYAQWQRAVARGQQERARWDALFNAQPDSVQQSFMALMSGDLGEGWQQALVQYKQDLADKQPTEASRKSSGNVLEVLQPHIPQMVGGSADLTGSNLTLVKAQKALGEEADAGYIYYGVREHAMGAIMNGMALHHLLPYGGTFLVFSDYMRPAMRLSALMEQQVIYVLTHDSIGLGEDGPTHQPVEHLAALRAIPNLQVLRPADATETLECWALALGARNAPTVLALSRQNLPHLRNEYVAENLSARGGYILRDVADASKKPDIVLIATGSEVSIACAAAQKLAMHNVQARVVSMPCVELFGKQPEAYRNQVLSDAPRIVVEAATDYGWARYLGEHGVFIGMQGFGASAPAEELYQRYGLSVENICKKALAIIN